MINLENNKSSDRGSLIAKVGDLVALANIDRNPIDTRVVEVGDTYIIVEGVINHEIKNRYAVAGGEVVKIVTKMDLEGTGTTALVIERGQFGTHDDIQPHDHLRTVVVLDPNNDDIVLTDWEFENTLGTVNSTLFPVELGSGTISIKSDLKLWSPHSTSQRFRVKPRRSMAYLFKMIGDRNVLKFTTIITKVRFNTKGKTEPNKIVLDIKTLLAKWYDKDVAINSQLKGTDPKEFFKLIFNLRDEDIYYSEGVDKTALLSINNLHTKEYKTVSELLKAYCSNGIRFIFDSKENLRIFADFKVSNLQAVKEVDYSITNLMLSENEQLIFNTIETQAYQRQTMYNFEDLDNQYVKYFKKLSGVVDSNKLITQLANGDYSANIVDVRNEDLHSSVQLKDYVIFKRTVPPYVEFPAQVISIDRDYTVKVAPILKDKDFRLFHYGKGAYLHNLLVTQGCKLDLHYVRESLPIIFKYTRNKGGEEVDSNLNYPLLPRVNGETKHTVRTNINFGCASNLKLGEYTGIIEEVDKIYGTWSSEHLTYNREIEQFANKNLPPIFALSNQVEERKIGQYGEIPIKNYTTFDNSNLLIEIVRPKNNQYDATIILSSDKNINSDIDLFVDTEISRVGNKIIQVSNINNYKLGDVLVANKPDDLTPKEELEYDEVISNIKWVVTGKEVQTSGAGDKHYIFLDSPFARRQSKEKKYSFTKYPNSSIVYLQELYFRGNPVIEYTQEVSGISGTVNLDGDTSIETYGEKPYSLDSKQLDKFNLRMLMGYILNNFQATDKTTTKYTLPISVFNSLELECLDLIHINDPILTGIDNQMLWLILSERVKANTNEVEYKLININSKDTEPFKVGIDDIMEYKPIEIPQYNHAGGEGNTEENNDGQGGTAVDRTLGQFWLAEVDPKEFRCRVDRVENNYIYFKDFNGTKYEEYLKKLFPVGEFAVNINGEVIFVQSDMEHRAYIKKRRVYDTTESVIISGDDVTFLVTTTYVDIDGTFYSRKMMVGDGDNYLSVDTIRGVKIVGDFVVGESNKHTDNDLWQSMQKNKTFQQPEQPTNTEMYKLKEGDIWYDTDDENHAYRYDGMVWVSARDGSIVSTHNNIYIQPDEPQDSKGKKILENDTWYNTSEGNKPYIYKGGKWIPVSDTTLQAEIDKVIELTEQNKNTLKDIYSDNKFTPSEKKQVSLIIDEIKAEYPKYVSESEKFGIPTIVYRQVYSTLINYITPMLEDSENTSDIVRSIFEDNFNKYYDARYDLLTTINAKIESSAIKSAKDYTDSVKDALEKDLTNQIDGKIDTHSQEEDPSLLWDEEQKTKHTGDLWYIPSQKITKRWNGSSWDEQIVKDMVAQGIAKSKRTVYTAQPTPPYEVGDLWVTDLLSKGDMKVCKTRRESGQFSLTDWVNATKYTDDTFAKEVEKQTQEAQKTADQAQAKLSDIASDDKLTPSEKQEAQKDWGIIQGEYQKIVDQCLLYGLPYTTYSNAYNNLSAYLTPMLSDLNSTSDIVGSTFRIKFKDYYDSRQELLNTIVKKAKELTEKAQNDATVALGNAKIFYQTSPPSGGMKKNDLWYDTDDDNHPHIYNGSEWVSARDKIYETEGGNKVYFQSQQPPTSGRGVKEGDQWFDTGNNNRQYILLLRGSRLEWVLANDALDKINQGRVILNGNTTVQGNFKVVGQQVELTGATKVNGILEVFSSNQGIISYNGTSESNSTQRIIIRGGEILFQEKV